MRAKYPPGYTVVDNPPFSILSEIVHVYMRAKVPFFLFAPHLTLLNIAAGRTDVTRLICDGRITYENGAQVNTDFVTNLDPEYVVRTVPTLRDAIMEADKANIAVKTLPKYEYPLELVTAADLGMLPRYGVEWNLPKDEAIFIRALDAMKAQDRQIFGGGLHYQPEGSRPSFRSIRSGNEKQGEKSRRTGRRGEVRLGVIDRRTRRS